MGPIPYSAVGFGEYLKLSQSIITWMERPIDDAVNEENANVRKATIDANHFLLQENTSGFGYYLI